MFAYLEQIRQTMIWIIQFLISRGERLCSISVVQTQLRKHVLHHADYTAPTRQHELHREYICLALKYLDHEVAIDDLSELLIRHHD